MQREIGNKEFPIWLLGDSNPTQWVNSLNTPLDPRHPIRHNIWTAVIEVIQEAVFLKHRLRVDTRTLYIRNAVDDSRLKPKPNSLDWSQATEKEVATFRALVGEYHPVLLLCFGAFSFEFARRALSQAPKHKYGYWGAETLGGTFRQRMDQFDPSAINAVPLLHRSISGGKFLESHKRFYEPDGNYFEFVGQRIAEQLIWHRDRLSIWVN